MADEKKKAIAKDATSQTAKSDKKDKKDKKDNKKPFKFSPKAVFKNIAKFFKDLRGETKKIVWPSRQMVLKSTGIVLAAILVIGAGIWLIDFALSSGVTAINNAAAATTTEAVSEKETEEAKADNAEKTDKESESTTTA